MRYLFTLNFVFGVVLVFVEPGSAQTGLWPVSEDSANIAILKFNYQTYEFEGASYSNYAPCQYCSQDSLPIGVNFHPPGDFGDITFLYTPTCDTLLFATIIWMGLGHIIIPASFDSSNSFVFVDSIRFNPGYSELLQSDSSLVDNRVDTLLQTLQKLGLSNLNQYAEEKSKVGIYLYPPTVGSFDPGPAKWIIFIYQDLNAMNIGDPSQISTRYTLVQNYPNPFNSSTTIRYSLSRQTHVKLSVFDLLGMEVKVLVDQNELLGEKSIILDASDMASGIYFYRLTAGDKLITKKLVVLK